MSDAPDQRLLEALLDSWDRNNIILVNLLHALPEGGLKARAMEGSPTVAQYKIEGRGYFGDVDQIPREEVSGLTKIPRVEFGQRHRNIEAFELWRQTTWAYDDSACTWKPETKGDISKRLSATAVRC